MQWSKNYLPLKLNEITEILKQSSKVKTHQNCTQEQYLGKYLYLVTLLFTPLHTVCLPPATRTARTTNFIMAVSSQVFLATHQKPLYCLWCLLKDEIRSNSWKCAWIQGWSEVGIQIGTNQSNRRIFPSLWCLKYTQQVRTEKNHHSSILNCVHITN